jgi:hypothetical protein
LPSEYSSTSLRLALSVNSEPGAGLVDEQTGAQPSIFTTGDLAIAFAVFDEFENVVDLSNITYVEADFVDDPKTGNILAQASIQTLAAVVPVIAWRNGTQAQGEISFTTDQLAALVCRAAWLVVRALTAAGEVMIFGAGWVKVNASGVPAVVKMPLSPVPSVIPVGAVYEIPAGVTITFPTSPKILGQLILDPASNGLPAGSFVITAA